MTASAHTFPVPQILVVDDDVELRGGIADYLSQHGYGVLQAGDALAMERVLADAAIDLIVLDLMLPGEDGLSICRRIADAGGPAIIMLSAMGEEIDRILGLELGADDYLAKPCSPRELLARVRAVLRRREDARGPGPVKGKAYYFLGFTLDGVRRQLRAPNGVNILLTAGEFSLLSVFLDNPQRILSRDQLIEKARGAEADVYDRAIDVQISRLRRKLNDCAPRAKSDTDFARDPSSGHLLRRTGDHFDGKWPTEVIKTYRGAGYLFDAKVTRP